MPCLDTRALLFSLLLSGAACAQELEPRAYSTAPVGTNFLVANYTRLSGEVSTDPSAPIANVQATIDVYTMGYSRSFALGDRLASAAIIIPYVNADLTGDVFEQAAQAHRGGLGDMRLRFALNLIGNPAVAPRDFAKIPPRTSVGASLSVVVPTGQYTQARLINVGSNRWAFKPEVGVSQPFGDWFVEGSAGVWLFADNNEFFRGQHRSQDPLGVFQLHTGYNFKPGFWIAANAALYTGGRTTVDGVDKEDLQHNSRYGATLSVPLAHGWSGKLAWSKGLATRIGGNYDIVSATLQYRWFD